MVFPEEFDLYPGAMMDVFIFFKPVGVGSIRFKLCCKVGCIVRHLDVFAKAVPPLIGFTDGIYSVGERPLGSRLLSSVTVFNQSDMEFEFNLRTGGLISVSSSQTGVIKPKEQIVVNVECMFLGGIGEFTRTLDLEVRNQVWAHTDRIRLLGMICEPDVNISTEITSVKGYFFNYRNVLHLCIRNDSHAEAIEVKANLSPDSAKCVELTRNVYKLGVGGSESIELIYSPSAASDAPHEAIILLETCGFIFRRIPVRLEYETPLLSSAVSSADLGTVVIGEMVTVTLDLTNQSASTLGFSELTLIRPSETCEYILPEPVLLNPLSTESVSISIVPLKPGNIDESIIALTAMGSADKSTLISVKVTCIVPAVTVTFSSTGAEIFDVDLGEIPCLACTSCCLDVCNKSNVSLTLEAICGEGFVDASPKQLSQAPRITNVVEISVCPSDCGKLFETVHFVLRNSTGRIVLVRKVVVRATVIGSPTVYPTALEVGAIPTSVAPKTLTFLVENRSETNSRWLAWNVPKPSQKYISILHTGTVCLEPLTVAQFTVELFPATQMTLGKAAFIEFSEYSSSPTDKTSINPITRRIPLRGSFVKPAIRIVDGNFQGLDKIRMQAQDAADSSEYIVFISNDCAAPLSLHINSSDPLLGLTPCDVEVPPNRSTPLTLHYDVSKCTRRYSHRTCAVLRVDIFRSDESITIPVVVQILFPRLSISQSEGELVICNLSRSECEFEIQSLTLRSDLEVTPSRALLRANEEITISVLNDGPPVDLACVTAGPVYLIKSVC